MKPLQVVLLSLVLLMSFVLTGCVIDPATGQVSAFAFQPAGLATQVAQLPPLFVLVTPEPPQEASVDVPKPSEAVDVSAQPAATVEISATEIITPEVVSQTVMPTATLTATVSGSEIVTGVETIAGTDMASAGTAMTETAVVSVTTVAQTPPPVEITTTQPLTEPVLPGVASTVPTTTATIRNKNVNIRSGPGMDFSVVTVAAGGDKFDVVGKSEDGAWWNICCVAEPGTAGAATKPAWVATSVVQVEGAPDQVSVIGPLFPQDLSVDWLVDYKCDSERCQVSTCNAQMNAKGRSIIRGSWLEIDRVLKWQAGCAEDSSVLGQIDRYSGQERYAVDGEAFIYRYWAGVEPGPANTVFTLSDGRQINAWCQDSLQAEVDEGGGWTTIYDGSTCYDVNSGILLNMSYTKRWLFSGTFDGQTYERAFLGDSESYDITFDTTNFTGLSVRATQ